MTAPEKSNVMDQLKEITECCICTEVFSNPKLLPCAHTFCLACLQQLGRDRDPATEMACPVCRKGFTVPAKGLGALPSNFFMRNLVEISGNSRRSTLTSRDPRRSSSALSCDLCAKTQRRSGAIEARVRCEDCAVNLCEDCAKGHGATKGGGGGKRTHRIEVLEAGGGSGGGDGTARRRKDTEEMLRLQAGVSCVLHPSRKIRMYCLDCRMSICMLCFADAHRAHRCSSVGNVSRDIRRQLQSEIERLSGRIAETRDRLGRLQGEKGTVDRQVKNTENSIVRRSAEVKAIVDRHAQRLVEELDQVRARKAKEIDLETEGLQGHIAALAGCQSRVRGIRERARIGGVDVLRDVRDVQVKIDELDATFVANSYFPVQIAFRANELDEVLKGELVNFVGKTEVKNRSCRRLVRLNTNDRRASGVAAVCNRWFVTCWQTTSVLIFDCQAPFARLPDLHVPRMKSARDLAGCERSRCLYVVDGSTCSVWKVVLNDPPVARRWLAGLGDPFTLSVSNKGRVVTLTDGRPPVLEVYGPDAVLLRRLRLPDTVESPQHAVETARGAFLVCHGWTAGRAQRVVELGREDASVARRYPPDSGTSGQVLNRPCHLAVDGDGRVMVADSLNHRVVLLDAQLGLDQVLLTGDHDDLNQPSRLCFARNSGQLLVAHRTGVDVFTWTE